MPDSTLWTTQAAATADRRPYFGARAAQLTLPGSVISIRSGLLLHGLPTPRPREQIPPLPTLTLERTGGRAAGVALTQASLSASDLALVRGWPVTSIPRTAVDVVRGLTLPEALVVADAAARVIAASRHPGQWVDRAVEVAEHREAARLQLVDAAVRATARRHQRQLDAALSLVDARSESALVSLRLRVEGPRRTR